MNHIYTALSWPPNMNYALIAMKFSICNVAWFNNYLN